MLKFYRVMLLVGGLSLVGIGCADEVNHGAKVGVLNLMDVMQNSPESQAIREKLEGEFLYPLNQLKEVFPSAYDYSVKKYEGREYLLDAKIPTLNCLWNDVLHLTAVHPSDIEKALVETGFKDVLSQKFFKIDPKLLDVENTTVYLYRYKGPNRHSNLDNYELFDKNDLQEYSIIPKSTKEYYKEMFLENKNPLLYHRIPHILYKGVLEINNLEIITL